MECKSCGILLPPGAKHCPNCGVPVASPPGPFVETASSSSSSPAVSADRIVLPNAPPYTAVPSATNPTLQNYGQSANTPPAMQPPAYYAASAQAQPKHAEPKPTAAHSRGLSRRMTILLVALALLIMSSGIGLIYYTTVYHPNELRVQATNTVQAIQTRDERSTVTANAQATGTAVAYANATATAGAQATAAARATATALQNVYTSATQGSPILNDSLAGNTGSGWDENLAEGGGGCAFTGGTYHASLFKRGFYFPCIARNTDFSNFAFQVQMTITKGDEGGLIFRGDGTNTKFYAFRVSTSGIYDLFTAHDNSHSSELAYGSSSAFKKNIGQTNLLTIIARGSNIHFYINKQYVGSINDNTYKSGQIGFFAEDLTNPTDVAFSNAQVWKL